MLKLIVENSESARPVMPVRWCLDKAGLEELKKRGARDPHILLSVKNENDFMAEVDRKICPINQLMEYVEFKKPGRHTVFATVVWHSCDYWMRIVKKRLMHKINSSTYDMVAYDYNKDFCPRLLEKSATRTMGMASADVVVADGFFAKRPPKLLAWWFNLGFDYPFSNQCQFRRRIPFALAKIFLVPAWAVVRGLCQAACVLWHLIFGWNTFSFKSMLHPFDMPFNSVWKPAGYYSATKENRYIFFKDKEGLPQPPYIACLAPGFYIILFCVFLLLKFSGVDISTADALIYSIFLVWWVLLFIWAVFYVDDKVTNNMPKIKKMKSEKPYSALDEGRLACDGGNLKANYNTLPARLKVRLAYGHVKSLICKPFAQ